METELKRCPKDAKTILHTPLKINRGGLGKIFGWAGDLTNLEALIDDLCEHLIIEDKVIRVVLKIKRLQKIATEGSITGVIFGQLIIDHNVFDMCQDTIRKKFVEGHPTSRGANAQNTGP